MLELSFSSCLIPISGSTEWQSEGTFIFTDTLLRIGRILYRLVGRTSTYSTHLNVNVNVWYLREFSRLYNLHPWYWNSLLHSLISPGENSTAFLQLMPFTIFRSTRYPSLMDGQKQYSMRSLPDISTHDQQWESNSRPSILTTYPLGHMLP